MKQYSRTELPKELKEVLFVSKYLNLYMLEREGEGKFLFSDSLSNQFKVSLFPSPSCSCLPGNNDHCMHTFYALHKIFKIDQQDPLIYQKLYTKQQIAEIIEGKRQQYYKNIKNKEKKLVHSEKLINKKQKEDKKETKIQNEKKSQTQKQIAIKSKEKQEQIEQNPKNEGTVPPQIQAKTQKEEEIEWPSFQEGTLCSICYQNINNETAIISCESSCQNYFHTKCLKIWLSHQQKSNLLASCPMCRNKIDNSISKKLEKQQLIFIKYHQSHQKACSQCGKDILIKLYKCILCKNLYLCQKCYAGWKHSNHDRFLMKRGKRQPWICSNGRNKFDMAKLNASMEYMKKFKDVKEIEVIFGPNYQKFIDQSLKQESVHDYVMDSFLSVEKEIFKTYKKLEFQEKDLKCCMCKKQKLTELKKLSCKHFMDKKCLGFFLTNGFRVCPYDKLYLLPGFQELELDLSKN